VVRLLTGAGEHSVRREHEMQATAGMLAQLGIAATMTEATRQVLSTVVADGVPRFSQQIAADSRRTKVC